MTNQNKKAVGFFILLLAAVLALAAGVYFLVIHGTFGLDSTHNGNCYDPLIVGLLIGGALIAAGLVFLKKYGLASAITRHHEPDPKSRRCPDCPACNPEPAWPARLSACPA